MVEDKRGKFIYIHPVSIVFLNLFPVILIDVNQCIVSHGDNPFTRIAVDCSESSYLFHVNVFQSGKLMQYTFGGITGGVIGLSLGVLLGLYLVGLDPETWKTEMDAEDAWIVVITALLGALLGSVFLGITGGVAGFSLGAILGLYLTGFAEGDEEHGG